MSRVNAIEARLHVADVARSAAFYADTLGFEIGTLWPDTAPEFAILSRDDVRLQLSIVPKPDAGSGCTLWLDVVDLDALHAALHGRIGIEWGPGVYDYGRREFAIRDPDGHLVVLSESVDDPPD